MARSRTRLLFVQSLKLVRIYGDSDGGEDDDDDDDETCDKGLSRLHPPNRCLARTQLSRLDPPTFRMMTMMTVIMTMMITMMITINFMMYMTMRLMIN